MEMYSIDRLVEFGMGIAISQQMVNSMNDAIKNMQIPCASIPLPKQNSEIYYVMIDNNPAGPFNEAEIGRLVLEKKIIKETYLWKPGMSSWDKAEKLPEILKLVALTPPSFPFNDSP